MGNKSWTKRGHFLVRHSNMSPSFCQILEADHIKNESPSMRLLTRDSNLYLIMVMLNCFASKVSAMINGDIGFSMHSGGKLNLGLLNSFSEPL